MCVGQQRVLTHQAGQAAVLFMTDGTPVVTKRNSQIGPINADIHPGSSSFHCLEFCFQLGKLQYHNNMHGHLIVWRRIGERFWRRHQNFSIFIQPWHYQVQTLHFSRTVFLSAQMLNCLINILFVALSVINIRIIKQIAIINNGEQ